MKKNFANLIKSVSKLWDGLVQPILDAPGYKYRLYIACAPLALGFGLGLILLFPNADPASLRNGLTILAEILGVLLGALLLIVTYLAQEGRQAEELLRKAYWKYHSLVVAHSDKVTAAFVELTDGVKRKKIDISESIYGEGNSPATKLRDVLGSLVALGFAVEKTSLDEAEKLLKGLEFTEEESESLLYGTAILATIEPSVFLKLIGDAFDVAATVQWCSKPVHEFARTIFEGTSQDGVDNAISRYNQSRDVLGGKLLATDLTLVASTTIVAVMTIFGTPDHGDFVFSYYLAIAVAFGFLISASLSLFLVAQLLD